MRNTSLTVEQAKALKNGDTVYINFTNPRFGEKISCYGMVTDVIENYRVNKNSKGQEFVWITVKYKQGLVHRKSMFASFHLRRHK